jgi:hypothetical protein
MSTPRESCCDLWAEAHGTGNEGWEFKLPALRFCPWCGQPLAPLEPVSAYGRSPALTDDLRKLTAKYPLYCVDTGGGDQTVVSIPGSMFMVRLKPGASWKWHPSGDGIIVVHPDHPAKWFKLDGTVGRIDP